MPVLGITGATGFIGQFVTRRLVEQGHYQIRALTRSIGNVDLIKGVSWLQGDLGSPADCEAFVRGLDGVLHFAHASTPLSSNRDWSSDAQLNVISTLNLLQALRKQDRRIDFVYPSSGGAVYGTGTGRPFTENDPCMPVSPYGIVKLTMESYLRLAAEQGWLNAVVLRIANPYGVILPPERMQGIIGVSMHQIRRGQTVPIYGNTGNVRDYIHLNDVADCIVLCLRPRGAFEVYNVGSGQGTSIQDLLGLLQQVAGKTRVEAELRAIEGADRLASWTVLDVSKAERQLGWRPRISLLEGLERQYREMGGAD